MPLEILTLLNIIDRILLILYEIFKFGKYYLVILFYPYKLRVTYI